ncbi:MAG TPA: hypothetical protein VLS93_16055, partial [Anaeromyxobacteraceae bacterium]|nr:hypothetical protein [Anaeromyxobacteraceae bacterium]
PPVSPFSAKIAGAPDRDEALPLASRIAGGLLVATALLELAFVASGQAGAFEKKLSGAHLLDVALGGALLVGRRERWIRAVTTGRVALGALILTPVFWVTQGWIVGIVQLAFSGGLLLLLVGSPGPLQIAAGVVGSGGVALVGLVGWIEPRVVTDAVAAASGYGSPVQEAQGRKVSWRIELPGDHWRAADEDGDARDTPDIDRTLVWLEKKATLLVMAQAFPKVERLSIDAVTGSILEATGQRMQKFEEISREPLLSYLPAANVVRARAETEGKAVEILYGIYVDGNVVIGALGFAPAEDFSDVERDLRLILASLRR